MLEIYDGANATQPLIKRIYWHTAGWSDVIYSSTESLFLRFVTDDVEDLS